MKLFYCNNPRIVVTFRLRAQIKEIQYQRKPQFSSPISLEILFFLVIYFLAKMRKLKHSFLLVIYFVYPDILCLKRRVRLAIQCIYYYNTKQTTFKVSG